jgi:hypothetical protein
MWLHTGTYTPAIGAPFLVVGFNQLGRPFNPYPKIEIEIIRRFVRGDRPWDIWSC